MDLLLIPELLAVLEALEILILLFYDLGRFGGLGTVCGADGL